MVVAIFRLLLYLSPSLKKLKSKYLQKWWLANLIIKRNRIGDKIGYWLNQTQLPPCPGTCPGEFPSNKNPIIGTRKEEQIRATFIFFPVIY